MGASFSIANRTTNLNHRDTLARIVTGESRTPTGDYETLHGVKAVANVRRAARGAANDWADMVVRLVRLVTDREDSTVRRVLDDMAEALADALACREWRATHGHADEAALDNARLLRALAASLTESADWIQDEVAA